MNQRIRIYLSGVGGQGTLTATTLLARTALLAGMDVVAGEIHGMAQRGGVVESVVLLGGWKAPKLDHGEADIILGFEPLETLRALPYLRNGGTVFSSEDVLPPVSVSMGKAEYPSLDLIHAKVAEVADRQWFLPCRSFGKEVGSVQSGNTSLLGALCASGVLPFDETVLEDAIKKFLPAKIVDTNMHAMRLGAERVRQA